ncbi:MAG TPA: DUF2239 family protein [Terracidiphilus sp.]|jgi:uncharacterized protein|nr:DUF2239 family protein [Terracidiphilus sp.]
MNTSSVPSCTAFAGKRLIASGGLLQVALKAQEVVERDKFAQVLIFDDVTSNLVEVDLRGRPEDLSRRIDEMESAGAQGDEAIAADGGVRKPGRPRLGVVAREVTLLPRHWEWLATQPGGASVAIRKLVEQARKANQGIDRVRIAQEAAYRFLLAMCGNEPGFEEANRALFAGNQERFAEVVEVWPSDLRDHAKRLASLAFVS